MKYKIIFTSTAREDLFQLYDYIADKSNPLRAGEYIERIEEACQSFSTFPARGTVRDNVRPGLRSIGFERRVTMAFHIEDKSVFIDHILYGGRSLEKAFDNDE